MLVALIRLDLDRVAEWMKRRIQRGRDSWFVFTCADVGVQMETQIKSIRRSLCN